VPVEKSNNSYTVPKPHLHIVMKDPDYYKEKRTVSPTIISVSEDNSEIKLDLCARKIYSLLFSNPGKEFKKSLVGVLTGYSHTSGGFNNAICNLNSNNLIIRGNNTLMVNPDNMREDLTNHINYDIKQWLSKLGACPRKIFDFLLSEPDKEFTKEEISEATGYQHSSGGFNNAICRLNSLSLITRTNGNIKINEYILSYL
jgi:hypothetical protein